MVGQHLHCETTGRKIGSISTSKHTHLATELRRGTYRKVKERKRGLIWRSCIFLYVPWLNLAHGDACNSTYARFSVRRPRESKLISSFFLFLGDCMIWMDFRQLSESKRNEKFAFLFYVAEASYLRFAICSLPYHAGNFLSQLKQNITHFLLPHLYIVQTGDWEECRSESVFPALQKSPFQ